jgi:RNA polymerase sigma-70 factor, ECF subfamily
MPERDGARPGAVRERPESALDVDEIRATLTRALARACPAWLAHERDDLVQTALVRILDARRRKGPDAVRAASYVWRTAYSVVVDEIRRRRREPRAAVGEEPPEIASNRTPEHERQAREAGAALRICLATLAEPRRVAVLLRLQGHGLAEAAGLAGWDVKRLENLAYRGLADLRRCLETKGVRP